jgi:hypothetical protein
MGDMWIAPVPKCPVHGQMNFTPRGAPLDEGTWICHGWDGEGCDHVVRGRDQEWTRIPR